MKVLDDMKALALTLAVAVLGCLAAASISFAAPPMAPLPRTPIIQVDWQYPWQLPRRFRNHCAVHIFSGRPYCSDHCGFDDQFYYCSPQSFGCCRVGFGYCDWSGLLRCAP